MVYRAWLFVLLFWVALPACAQSWSEPALSLDISTLGPGISLSEPIIDHTLNVTANINGYDLTAHNIWFSHTHIEGTMHARSAGVVFNYYPYHNWFSIDAGLYYNGTRITAHAIPEQDGSCNLWHVHYSSQAICASRGKVTVNPFEPYLGIGFGNRLDGSRFAITGRIGFLFMGQPKLQFMTNSNDAHFRERLRQKQIEYERHIGYIHWYPVVGLSVSYRL